MADIRDSKNWGFETKQLRLAFLKYPVLTFLTMPVLKTKKLPLLFPIFFYFLLSLLERKLELFLYLCTHAFFFHSHFL